MTTQRTVLFVGAGWKKRIRRRPTVSRKSDIALARVFHGHACRGGASPEYHAWADAIGRCTNPKVRNYKNYGGRGITVCAEWTRSFPLFLAHIGLRPTPKHSLERIDNERGYEPGNVRWATTKEQRRNTRRSQMLTAFGRTMSMVEWSEAFGIDDDTLRNRMKRGIAFEKALTTPVDAQQSYKARLRAKVQKAVGEHK